MRAFALPLVGPIPTAHGTLHARAGFLVSVEDETGRVAHGEATPLADFGTEDLPTCAAALRRGLLAWLEDPDAFADASSGFDGFRVFDGLAGGERGGAGTRARAKAGSVAAPCARAALESAWYDLNAQVEEVSLATWLRRRAGLAGDVLGQVAVQALVQGAEPADVEASARAAMNDGFGTFKLKLAVSATRRDVGLDLERVAALRAAVGPAARVRLDANEAWTRAEAEQALARLAGSGIDYVEQPVAREALSDLAALGQVGGIGIAADEALLGDGLARCLDARAASILVVKPSALGGVSAALSLVERAQGEGLRIVWSNLFEGVVGRALALALAAGTSNEGEVHGLGTAGLLAADLDEATDTSPSGEGRGGVLAHAALTGRARAVPPAWSRSDAHVWDEEVWEARA